LKDALGKLAVALCLATGLRLHGQGMVYDQQSATTPEEIDYDNFVISRLLLMQAFVPTLPSIGFVQLELTDYPDTSTTGAKMGIELYSGSPSDPTLLGTTELVSLPPNFTNDGLAYSGVATFYFATPIALVPGQTYYITPAEITGDNVWSVAVTDNTYPYGQLYAGGNPFSLPTDLWFREGIVATPEPSDLALLAMGGLVVAGIWGLKGKTQQQLKAQQAKVKAEL
jgi:hypothetical protein